jgi:hypothetical protein
MFYGVTFGQLAFLWEYYGISILVLWMAMAIRDIDANDDRSLVVITNAIVIAILEKFEMSSGVHSSAFWFPSADTVDKFFASVMRSDGVISVAPPNTPAEAESWPTLPDLLATLEGPKALKDFISPSFAPRFCLLPTAMQMGIYHLCYDLLSPKPLHRVSTCQTMEDARDRVGAPLFQSLFLKLMTQKKSALVFYEAKCIANCALMVAVSSYCLATAVSLVLADRPYTSPIPAAAIVADVAAYLESSMTKRLFSYTLGSPGMQLSKGKSADGVKYLVQQLSVSGSAYKMPSPESP